jgi:hypothetical protein
MKMLGAALLACCLAATRVAADGCGSPRFQPPVRYSVSAGVAVLVADVDGDGAPEILTSGSSVVQRPAFSLLRNAGNGTFAGERLIAAGLGEKLEDVADVNRDGIPDLLASDYWHNGIVIRHGSGSGEFGPAVPLGTATHGGPTRVIDVDRDSIPDVLSLSFGSANPVRVHVFRVRADGTLQEKATYDTTLDVGASPSFRVHDGAVEILVGDHSGRVSVLRVTSGGVTWERRDAGPGLDLNNVFADVDGDGIADIVDANESGGIFVTLAAPGGGFLERKQLENLRQLEFPTELVTGDFDRDGRLDLIAGDFRGTTLYWFRGRGDGSFDDGLAIGAGGPVNEIAVADVDRDSRPDLVTVNDDGTVSVIRNGPPCTALPRRRAMRH